MVCASAFYDRAVVYSSLFQTISAYSGILQPIPAFSSVFQHIPAHSSQFQLIPSQILAVILVKVSIPGISSFDPDLRVSIQSSLDINTQVSKVSIPVLISRLWSWIVYLLECQKKTLTHRNRLGRIYLKWLQRQFKHWWFFFRFFFFIIGLLFQPIPAYSSLFKQLPAYSSLL